ncbi:MAG: thermonuclease family protein [Hyphomicrobiaceae bacterium]|nr:thermonuclease family protein [Hyphomicrobiaceae bacterium]
MLRPPAAMAQAAVTLACDLEPGPTRAVASVIDGETVRLDDGKEVRLLGVLTPRAEDARGAIDGGNGAADWPPERDARLALINLVGGRSVALAFAGVRADRHERVLAHLFLNDEAGRDIWVQGKLVADGHARAHAHPAADACMAELVSREQEARSAGAGLWSHAAYQVRPGDRPRELALYENTFQLVRGRVERTGGGRSVGILEMTSVESKAHPETGRQRGVFRIIIKRGIERQGKLGRVDRLLGANILVRGWIETRAGPEITISSPSDIEREDDRPTPPKIE